MQLKRMKFFIVIVFAVMNVSLLYGQKQKYKLKIIDSVSYREYNFYYMELKKGLDTYKVLSEIRSDSIVESCIIQLKTKKKYNLHLERLYYIENEGFLLDLLKTRISINNRSIGGLSQPVYLSNNIFNDKIYCE